MCQFSKPFHLFSQTSARRLIGVRWGSKLTQEQKDFIANGPGLEKFVTKEAPPVPDHLKRKKGQRQRTFPTQFSLCFRYYTG